MMYRLPCLVVAGLSFVICNAEGKNIPAACSKESTMNFKKWSAEATLERILMFAYDLLSKKHEDFKTLESHRKEWLKNRPQNKNALYEYHKKHLLYLLSNPKYFKIITETVISNKALSDQDRKGFIIFLITTYLPHKGQYEYTYEDFLTYFGGSIPDLWVNACELYQRGENQILFALCTGLGNHNNGYVIYSVGFKDGKFYAMLLKGQKEEVAARGFSYEPKDDLLIVNVNAGDVTDFLGIQEFYKINSASLELIRKRSTKKYEAMCPTASTCYKIGANVENEEDWSWENIPS